MKKSIVLLFVGFAFCASAESLVSTANDTQTELVFDTIETDVSFEVTQVSSFELNAPIMIEKSFDFGLDYFVASEPLSPSFESINKGLPTGELYLRDLSDVPYNCNSPPKFKK